MILPGFVKKVMSYGVFVEFSTGIFGLAPNSVSTLAVLRKTIVPLCWETLHIRKNKTKTGVELLHQTHNKACFLLTGSSLEWATTGCDRLRTLSERSKSLFNRNCRCIFFSLLHSHRVWAARYTLSYQCLHFPLPFLLILLRLNAGFLYNK